MRTRGSRIAPGTGFASSALGRLARGALLLSAALAAAAWLTPSPARAVDSNTYWLPASGDWSDGNKWNPGLPNGAESNAHVQNGGTAWITQAAECWALTVGGGGHSGAVDLVSGSLYAHYSELVGSSAAGSFVQTGGQNTIDPSGKGLTLGVYGSGTYKLVGPGVLSAPTETLGVSGFSGNFIHTDGNNSVKDWLKIDSNGLYQLSGTGRLTVGTVETIVSATGQIIQTGGVNVTGRLDYDSGHYEMRGGDLQSSKFSTGGFYGSTSQFLQSDGNASLGQSSVGAYGSLALTGGRLSMSFLSLYGGRVTQSGGSAWLGSLTIQNAGLYQYSGGDLTIGGWVFQDGKLDFTGVTAVVQAADGAVLDFGQVKAGSIVNAQNITFTAGTNTLCIIPAGVDPNAFFGNFSTTGMVHVPGTNLVIAPGSKLVIRSIPKGGSMDIVDHIQCFGGFAPADTYNNALYLKNGFEVAPGGDLDVGYAEVNVNDKTSSVTGGRFSGHNTSRLYIGLDANAVFTQTGGEIDGLPVVVCTAVYNMTGGLITSNLTVGSTTTNASFVQTGGLVTGPVTVGYYCSTGSNNATYTLDGNGAINTAALVVGGESGRGQFYQKGGAVRVDTLSSGFGAYGRYDLSGGTLDSNFANIVNDFVQTGGTNTVAGNLQLGGNYPTPSTTYNLSGGTLDGNVEAIQDQFYQVGGQHNVRGSLQVGGIRTRGLYHMWGGQLQAREEVVHWKLDQDQEGGTNTVSETLYVGGGPSGAGNGYSLVHGNLTAKNETIAWIDDGNGYFGQSGGVNTVQATLRLAEGAASSRGYYDLSGGQLSAQREEVGYQGSGGFTQFGGTNTVGKVLVVAQQGTGSYYMWTGQLSASVEQIGCFTGSGSFTQNGGTNTVQQLLIGAKGQYILTGGTLNAGCVLFSGGKFDFSNSARVLSLSSGVLDVSNGQFLRAGKASLNLGPQALLIIAAGYDPNAVFKTYSNLGMTHVAGTSLDIPSGRTLSGSGVIADPTSVSGALMVGAADALTINNILNVRQGGRVDSNSSGRLTVSQLVVGADGTGSLNLHGATQLTVSNRLCLGAGSSVTADPGSVIVMTGSVYDNQSTDPKNLAGLRNLSIVFQGGDGNVDSFEVAGEDLGADANGFLSNFGLAALQLGGDGGPSDVILVDRFKNQPDSNAAEALYLQSLAVNPGSELILNGIHLYVNGVPVNPADGDLYGGGEIYANVPEPASLLLLALGAVAVLRRKPEHRR